MLRFAEEILLLILDNSDGDIASSLPPHSLDTVLAGAVLMDLALEDRIDTDLEKLMLADSTPVGDDLLDPILAEIAEESGSHPIGYWLERTARKGDDIRGQALAKLVERGILKSDDYSLFFLSHRVSRSKRYPVTDGKTTEEVTFRIMRLLFSDDIPDPRDIVIVSLAAASDVFSRILSREELAEAQSRIDLISGMDLIGQSVARAVAQQPMASLPSSPSARSPEEIPMVSGWPLVGSALDMAGDLRSFLTRQYRDLDRSSKSAHSTGAISPSSARRPIALFRSGGESSCALTSRGGHSTTRWEPKTRSSAWTGPRTFECARCIARGFRGDLSKTGWTRSSISREAWSPNGPGTALSSPNTRCRTLLPSKLRC